MRNYLIIGGKDSRDFGVYISGQGTFSAPEKAYEFYNVPGRSGAILGNDHRLENIEVSYQCFIYNDFSTNIADFRTYLLSLNGYQRLTDSYHPDEYRMAVYVGPFEPEVTSMNDAGSFELVFNCKPQRYLISGETKYSWIPGSAQVISGESVDIYGYGERIDTSVLLADISLYYSGVHDWYENSYSFLGGFRNVALYLNGNQVYIAAIYPYPQTDSASTVHVNFITGEISVTYKIINLSGLSWSAADAANGIFKTSSVSQFDSLRNCNYYPIRDVSTAASLADAQTALNAFRSGLAIYNGTILIKEPELVNKTAAECQQWLTNLDGGLGQVRCDGHLSTPEVISVQPYIPNYPSAIFNMAAKDPNAPDTSLYPGSVYTRTTTMQYLPNDNMSNPTMFPSEPLIRVYSTGSFTMDGVTVTITDCDSFVDIDCELMDCYEGSINRNNDVIFSTYDFPKLQPGDNEVNIVSGITLIEMIPRWWRV